jgi:hypothetical protein
MLYFIWCLITFIFLGVNIFKLSDYACGLESINLMFFGYLFGLINCILSIWLFTLGGINYV